MTSVRVCCVSKSVAADEPRLLRNAEALRDAGHDVIVIGFAGGRSASPSVQSTLVDPGTRASVLAKGLQAGRLLGVTATGRGAVRTFDRFEDNALLAEAVVETPADLYIARHWEALPAVARAAKRHGAMYAYDSPELAFEQQLGNRRWRLLFRRYVEEVEAQYIGDAVFITAVSGRIADALQQHYRLTHLPTVLRNVPKYVAMPFREPGETINVLYHGGFAPERGVEQLIDSVKEWPPNYRLQLRGYGAAPFVDALRQRSSSAGLDNRIEFLPVVPMEEVVSTANRSDIGIHPLQGSSRQLRFALPNKLFEYVMAGLAVCVSDLPEMAAIVESYGVGELIDQPTPAGIATTLDRMDVEAIADYKRRSLVAARELCWDKEKYRLLELVDKIHL